VSCVAAAAATAATAATAAASGRRVAGYNSPCWLWTAGAVHVLPPCACNEHETRANKHKLSLSLSLCSRSGSTINEHITGLATHSHSHHHGSALMRRSTIATGLKDGLIHAARRCGGGSRQSRSQGRGRGRGRSRGRSRSRSRSRSWSRSRSRSRGQGGLGLGLGLGGARCFGDRLQAGGAHGCPRRRWRGPAAHCLLLTRRARNALGTATHCTR
jgi:hypothetical protein